jgi:hypothetical protein
MTDMDRYIAAADALAAGLIELRNAYSSELFNSRGNYYEPGKEPEIKRADAANAEYRAAREAITAAGADGRGIAG